MSTITDKELNSIKQKLAERHRFKSFDEYYWRSSESTSSMMDVVARYFYEQGFKDATQGSEIIQRELGRKNNP